ncbi:MAG: DUF1636 domain-containing protein [Hyphomicrobiales bacterium]
MTRTIIVCQTCKFSQEAKLNDEGLAGGEILTKHLEDVLGEREDLVIQKQDCLWACSDHCNVLMSDSKRFSYLAGRFEPKREAAEAIVQWFDKHGENKTGQVPFREWPDEMRGHFIARLPAQNSPSSTDTE